VIFVVQLNVLDAMSAEIKRSTLVWTYLALLGLLALTAAANYLPPSPWSTPLSLAIATAKLVLIFLVFMQLRWKRGLVRLAAVTGFLWLGIAALLTFSDYLTRGWPL
jgi:cytochrome c oxidase subunit 4